VSTCKSISKAQINKRTQFAVVKTSLRQLKTDSNVTDLSTWDIPGAD